MMIDRSKLIASESTNLSKMAMMNVAEYLKKKVEKKSEIGREARAAGGGPGAFFGLGSKVKGSTSEEKRGLRTNVKEKIGENSQRQFSKRSARGFEWQGQGQVAPPKMEVTRARRPNKESTLSRLAASISKSSKLNLSRGEIGININKDSSKQVIQNKFQGLNGDEWKTNVNWKRHAIPLKQKVMYLDLKFPISTENPPIKKPVMTGELILSSKNDYPNETPILSKNRKFVKQMQWDLAIKNMPTSSINRSSLKNKCSSPDSQSWRSRSPQGSICKRHLMSPEEITFRPQYSSQKSPGYRGSFSSRHEPHRKSILVKRVKENELEEIKGYEINQREIYDLSYSPECLSPLREVKARVQIDNSTQTRKSTFDLGFEISADKQASRNDRHINIGTELIDRECSEQSETKTVDKFLNNCKDDQSIESADEKEIPPKLVNTTYKTKVKHKSPNSTTGLKEYQMLSNRYLLTNKSETDENKEFNSTLKPSYLKSPITLRGGPIMPSNISKFTNPSKIRNYSVEEVYSRRSSQNPPPQAFQIPMSHIPTKSGHSLTSLAKNPLCHEDQYHGFHPSQPLLSNPYPGFSAQVRSLAIVNDSSKHCRMNTLRQPMPNNPNTPSVIPDIDSRLTDKDDSLLVIRSIDRALYDFDDVDHCSKLYASGGSRPEKESRNKKRSDAKF